MNDVNNVLNTYIIFSYTHSMNACTWLKCLSSFYIEYNNIQYCYNIKFYTYTIWCIFIALLDKEKLFYWNIVCIVYYYEYDRNIIYLLYYKEDDDDDEEIK